MRITRARATSDILTLGIVLTAALLIRIAVLVIGWGSLAADDDAYGRLAVYWAETGTYGFPAPADESPSDDSSHQTSRHADARIEMRPTAYRPPLYPWVLSWFVDRGQLNLIAVAVTHLWLGVASVGLTFGIASRLQIRPPALPAIAVAADPILLRGSQLVMTETLITFVALAIWGLWLRIVMPTHTQGGDNVQQPHLGKLALLGLLLGLAVLTRPTMLPWAVCLIGLSALASRFNLPGARGGATQKLPPRSHDETTKSSGEFWELRAGISSALIVGAVLSATLLPWMVRNARMLGKPLWATTHGGYTLLLANNPSLYAHFQARGPTRDWDATDFHRHWALRRTGDPRQLAFWQTPVAGDPIEPPIDELSDDRLAQQAAKATIARQPGMFVLSCLYRIGWFWALTPHESSRTARLLIGAWYGLWFLLALCGAVSIGRGWLSRAWLAPAAFILTLTLVHAVYWSNMRMRAPLMPMLYVVATAAISSIRTRKEPTETAA